MKAKQVNEEISQLVKGFDVAYGKAVAPFTDWLLINLKASRGRTVNQIINEGWIKFDVSTAINNSIVATSVQSAKIKILSINPLAVIDEKKLTSDVLYEAWASDGRALNTRMLMANTKTKKYIAESVKADFSVVRKYDDNLKKINAKIKLAPKLDENLLRGEVRALTQDIRKLGFTNDYEKQLKALEKKISSLAEMNYPTSDTKKAYQGFIKAVRGKNIEAFEKSVEEAVKKKSRYISRRIARTEQARASTDSYLLMYEDDEDVVAYRWRLDASHRVTDVCDINARADFGLGAGVYPKNKIPPLPAHTQCTCYLTPIVEGDIDEEATFDYSKGGNSLLNKLPAREQNKILGSVERGKAFRKGKDWDNAMVGNPKPQDLKTRFEGVIESKFI